MAKNIWIRASIRNCSVLSGKLQMETLCGNYQAVGENVYAEPTELKELPNLLCFVKGMVNSSQNALARTADSWGPLGRMSTRFTLQHGVAVYHISNEFSRDGDIDCVLTKEDAEKLCLLSRHFPCYKFTLLQIAEKNGFDIERLSARGLKTLETAICNRIHKHAFTTAELSVDDRIRAMVIAGI